MGLPGEQEGNGAIDVLFGVVAPSGKLPHTLPNKWNEVLTPLNRSVFSLPLIVERDKARDRQTHCAVMRSRDWFRCAGTDDTGSVPRYPA